MNREFEFFITETDSKLKLWAKQKSKSGSVLVGNAGALIDYLVARTGFGDDLTCRVSGGWLEQCIAGSVRRLLEPVRYADYLNGRTVTGVMVDLSTSIAWCDRDMSIGDKRELLKRDLGEKFLENKRLTILP